MSRVEKGNQVVNRVKCSICSVSRLISSTSISSFWVLSGLVALLSFSCSSHATVEPFKLDLYTDEFPPLQVQVDGQAKGYVVEFVEAIVKDAATEEPMLSHQVQFMPWKRAMRITQHANNALLFSISRTPEREEQYQWIGEVSPYEVAIYRHKDGPTVNPDDLDALKTYRFGFQSGSAFEEVIKAKGFTNVMPVTFGREAIRLLRGKRVDFAPLVSESYYYRMEQFGFEPEDYVSVMKVDALCKKLWLVTGKSTPPNVVNALKRSYHKLSAQAQLEKFIEKYQPNSDVMIQYRKQKMQQG